MSGHRTPPLARAKPLLALLAAVLPSACVSIAPPIRTDHYGAPGRVEAGMVEAAGQLTYGPDLAGGPRVGYGISDALSVEAGAEINHRERAIGWLGARYTPLRPDDRRLAFVLDLEGGAGAGVGGQRCEGLLSCETDAQDFRRPAGGGYLGLGLGGKIDWFWPWLRVRTQASGAKGIPFTSLTTALVGVQFSIASLAHIYAGTGGYLIANENLAYFGWFTINAGLSFTIPTARTRRAHEQRSR